MVKCPMEDFKKSLKVLASTDKNGTGEMVELQDGRAARWSSCKMIKLRFTFGY